MVCQTRIDRFWRLKRLVRRGSGEVKLCWVEGSQILEIRRYFLAYMKYWRRSKVVDLASCGLSIPLFSLPLVLNLHHGSFFVCQSGVPSGGGGDRAIVVGIDGGAGGGWA
jgi:hypothetical protein